MKKISKKELSKLEKQMHVTVNRGNTWTGIRPAVFKSVKHDKKARRAEGKKLCMAY